MPKQPIAVELEAINRAGSSYLVDTIESARLSVALAIPITVQVPESLTPVKHDSNVGPRAEATAKAN